MSGNRERGIPACFPTMENMMNECAICHHWHACLEVVLLKQTKEHTRDLVRQFMNEVRESKRDELFERKLRES